MAYENQNNSRLLSDDRISIIDDHISSREWKMKNILFKSKYGYALRIGDTREQSAERKFVRRSYVLNGSRDVVGRSVFWWFVRAKQTDRRYVAGKYYYCFRSGGNADKADCRPKPPATGHAIPDRTKSVQRGKCLTNR